MTRSLAPYIHVILADVVSITLYINKPLVRLTTVHYQSAVSMISFAQVLTAQWSDTIPKRNVRFQVGITSHDIPFQQTDTLAQWVEHHMQSQKVASSIPASVTFPNQPKVRFINGVWKSGLTMWDTTLHGPTSSHYQQLFQSPNWGSTILSKLSLSSSATRSTWANCWTPFPAAGPTWADGQTPATAARPIWALQTPSLNIQFQFR